MVQATNELILGFELNEEYAQMSYFHQSVKEPVTVGRVPGEEEGLLPLGLRQSAQGVWQLWDGVPPGEEEGEDLFQIQDLYRKIERGEKLEYQGQTYEPEELLSIYFQTAAGLLKLLLQNARLQVMVTVRTLTQEWSDLIVAALTRAGVNRRDCYMQDYLSSFYYYTVNQKKELWSHDVALVEYVDETVIGYVLEIDRTTRPAVASVKEAARQSFDAAARGTLGEQEWRRERDRLFFEMLKKVFERRNVAVTYLVGDYFERSWAERSIDFLCHKRHAFQGKNLYSRGACYAAMERAGFIADRGILFGGRDMIQVNLGMEMRISGKEKFYPLISAGINWYEAHRSCEFIPDGEREIRITSRPMAEGETVVHRLRLTGLPPRPNRATRLRMTVYFSSPSCCIVEVEDLGFGELYRSSRMTWTRKLMF